MIAQGQSTLSADPRYVLLPSAALFITVVCVQPAGRRAARALEQPVTEPLLEVSDLRVDFRHDGRLVRAVDGLTLLDAPRAHGGGDRRVRVGQDRQRAGDHGAAAADGDGHRVDPIR